MMLQLNTVGESANAVGKTMRVGPKGQVQCRAARTLEDLMPSSTIVDFSASVSRSFASKVESCSQQLTGEYKL